MTQPTSLTQTFDTSLIDTQSQSQSQSFSTTDSAPSDDYKQPSSTTATALQPMSTSNPKFEEASTTARKMPTRYVPTVDAYDAWADVYDSDGNMMQAVDDYELASHGGGMMDEFVKLVLENASAEAKGLDIVDLGCGTGRNTLVLLSQKWPTHLPVTITGIDASAGMLARARSKITEAAASSSISPTPSTTFIHHDFLNPLDATAPPTLLPTDQQYTALLSTLVLEHFPLPTFFAVLSSLLHPNAIVLLTDMHPDMGAKSQAGFVSLDETTGEAVKVRGTSWVHGVERTVEEAQKAGFEVVGGVRERGVSEQMVGEGVVGERGRKWVGVMVWVGMILRKVR